MDELFIMRINKALTFLEQGYSVKKVSELTGLPEGLLHTIWNQAYV